LTNPMSPFLNRATKGLFPPGSVFKVPVALCGLDSQKIIPHTTFSCPGYHEVGGIRFGCTHAHGPQNLIQSLSHSCNVYYYHLGMTLGANLIARYARMLGLGKLTHIDLPYEKTGYVPSRRQGLLYGRRRWYTGDTLNLSIGQGDVLTTPLQLIRMMGIVANEGVEVQPHVIQKVSGVPVEKYDFKRQLKIDLEAFRTVKKGLRAAVVDYSGTAHVLDVKGLTVAGKTGTAQTSRRREHHAWFVGYAQNRNKKIAICVFLEYGGSSQNACLLARQLLVHMQKQGVL